MEFLNSSITLPNYLPDLVIAIFLLLGLAFGFLFRSKFVYINCFIFGGLLIVCYFAVYPFLRNLVDVELIKMINSSGEINVSEVGITLDTSSLQSLFGSVYDNLLNISFQIGSTLNLSREAFVANIESLSGGICMFVIFVADFIVSFLLTIFVYIFVKIFEKKKTGKKNSVLVGGFVNLVFVFGVISVAMYFVYGISNCAVELSHAGDGLTDRLDAISKLSDSITKLSGNLNTLKDHYSYYLSSDLATQLNNIDGLLKQAGDLITKYTAKDSQIYQAIVNINSQMGNLRDTINSVVMKPTYLTFMSDIDYGFLKVSLSNGENLSLAENISNSIDAIKNLILKPVDSIASNADSLLDFANDFLVDVDQQFQSMGL